MVIFQGFLGGLRVLLDKQNIEVENNFIARSFAVCHACGAQVVICIIAALVISTSRRWYSSLPKENPVYGKKVYHLGLIASVILFLQIFVGAIMRHSKAALAIPHFPMSTADGGLLPSAWNWMVAINFAHRVGAVLVTVALILFFYHLWRSKEHRNEIGPIIYVPAFLLIIQIFLGALVIWTLKNEHAATIHTLVGAFLLSSCWAITYHSTKLTSSYKKKIVQQPNKALVSLAS
jgi:cytochrome c oxidase assembly protein subunit 15